MESNNQVWFEIFGDGGPWVQTSVNLLIGVLMTIFVVATTGGLISVALKAKIETNMEQQKMYKAMAFKKTFTVFGVLTIGTGTFVLANMFKVDPSTISIGEWFTIYGDAAPRIEEYFYMGTSLGFITVIIVFIIFTIARGIKYNTTHDVQKMQLIKQKWISSIGWFVFALLVPFTVSVVFAMLPAVGI